MSARPPPRRSAGKHRRPDALLKLYEKGEAPQWNTNTRIDRTQDLDPGIRNSSRARRCRSSAPRCGTGPPRVSGRTSAGTPGAAALAIPARRAGRPGLRGGDRPAGAEHRRRVLRQVLRRHAGHGRGAPRRFGRLALRDHCPQITYAERHAREEFAVEVRYLMRERFLAHEVWDALALLADECVRHVEQSQALRGFPRAAAQHSRHRSPGSEDPRSVRQNGDSPGLPRWTRKPCRPG